MCGMKNTTNLSRPMIDTLLRLTRQESAAIESPGAYSADLWIGTVGAHTATCDALIGRGLVTEGARHGFRTATLNDAGRVAIRDVGALLLAT